jgi:transposase
VRAIVRGCGTEVFRPRISSLDAFLPHLEAERANGCCNGAELWRRVRAASSAGALRVVTEWTTRQRERSGTPQSKPPSARAIAPLLTGRRDLFATADAVLAAAEQAVPALALAQNLLERFHSLPRSKSSAALDAWLSHAANSLVSSFATGIAADRAGRSTGRRERIRTSEPSKYSLALDTSANTIRRATDCGRLAGG